MLQQHQRIITAKPASHLLISIVPVRGGRTIQDRNVPLASKPPSSASSTIDKPVTFCFPFRFFYRKLRGNHKSYPRMVPSLDEKVIKQENILLLRLTPVQISAVSRQVMVKSYYLLFDGRVEKFMSGLRWADCGGNKMSRVLNLKC